MKSSQKSRATVPQRLMFKERRKVGRRTGVVSLERICKWEEETEQVGKKGLREELKAAETEEGCVGESKMRVRGQQQINIENTGGDPREVRSKGR